MKNIFASLGVILLVAVLGVATVFAYGSYKDLELKKEQAKVTENKQKNSKDKASKKEQKNQTSNQTETQESTNTNNNNTNEVRTTEDGEEIKKTKNGIDYTGEFDSPEEEQEFEKGVMAQSGGGSTNGENTEESSPKYTVEDARNMSDDEFLEAYKEGMTEEEAAAVDSRAEGPGDYIGFLRGQVEARANGQGANY